MLHLTLTALVLKFKVLSALKMFRVINTFIYLDKGEIMSGGTF